jgi:hypothetical protein
MTAPRAGLLLLLAACTSPGIDLDAQYGCSTTDQCGSEDYECCLGICRRVGTFDENSCIRDAGTPDAGVPDAGSPPDAGPIDSGTPDSGTPDSGTMDAGGTDSGSPDAGDGGM